MLYSISDSAALSALNSRHYSHLEDIRELKNELAVNDAVYEVISPVLTEDEARRLWMPAATKPENVTQDFFERAFAAGGFSVIEADVISSEWREYAEETKSRTTSKQLLRIARLRRHRERYIAQFGEKDYACELSNCHYGVYQMLGKLSPIIYTLVNSANDQERSRHI